MARWRRIAPANTVFHVLNRANNRAQIFFTEGDYRNFLCLLADTARRIGMRILAYCVMPNHWHVIVWPTEDGQLCRFMYLLTKNHALGYRVQTGTIGHGHVYQARYRGFPVQTERYYYNVVRYVEANAYRAGLVSRAEEWAWSSAFERVEGAVIVSPGPIELPDTWIQLVNRIPPPAELEALRACAQRQRPYGLDAWVGDAAVRCGLEHALRPRGRPSNRAENVPGAIKE